MSETFALTLPARPESAGIVRHVLGGVVPTWPVGDALLHDMRVAVTEACANVVKHAYADAPAGLLEVTGDLVDGHVVIAVRDNGPGVRPRAGGDGLGLGLPLMAALTDSLEFRRAGDGAHEVQMTFPKHGAG